MFTGNDFKRTNKISVPEGFKNPYNARRKRKGKTAKDRAGNAHARAASRKAIPIRCTSSHNPSSWPEKGQDFWGRG